MRVNAHSADKLTWVCVYKCAMQIIMAKPAGGPRAPKQRGHWDKDDWDEEPERFDTHN